MLGRRLFTVVIVACGLLGACGREHGQSGGLGGGSIHLAIVATAATSASSRDWAPIIKDMEARTGLPVSAVFTDDGPRAVKSVRTGATDIALFSDQSGLQAVRQAGGEVFARALNSHGAADYAAVLIVGAKSALTLPRVLKCDHSLTLGQQRSRFTSAALAPEAYLFAPLGQAPDQCFRRVLDASPKANLAAVAEGKIDVAASDTRFLETERGGGDLMADKVRAIWRSPPLPGDPLIWRGDLDPAVKEKARQFFLTYGEGGTAADAAQRANLARVGVGGFSAADDSHLLPAREMEAARVWMRAKASGDKARIAAARGALDMITAEREALEARTRVPAAAQ